MTLSYPTAAHETGRSCEHRNSEPGTLVDGGVSVDDEFIQTKELHMAGPTAIQEKVQACNGISHLPFVPGTSCFSSKSMIEASFMVFVVAKSLPCLNWLLLQPFLHPALW